MTSNETYEQVHANMSAMGLATAESILDNWIGMATERNLPIIDVLNNLLTQEISSRLESAIRTRTKLAGFPVKKSLDDFDLEFQASIDKKVVNDLRTLRFVNNAENLILLGPSGVGKTHIAIGLGIDAIKAGFSVYFINSAVMIEKLKVASQRGNLERNLKTLGKYKVLIVDETGYLPMDKEGEYFFIQLVSRRYEKG